MYFDLLGTIPTRVKSYRCSYLNSELPEAAYGYTRDRTKVVGGHDAADLSTPHTRHAFAPVSCAAVLLGHHVGLLLGQTHVLTGTNYL